MFESFDERYDGASLIVGFSYLLEPDFKIRNEIVFPNVSIGRYEQIKGDGLSNLFFHLGLGEMMLMWRFACPQNIKIKAGYLNNKQLLFWKDVFTAGFGEFYYKEKINFKKKDFLLFHVLGKKTKPALFKGPLIDRDLLLTTGGKDSAVTMEILRNSEREIACLLLDPQKSAIQACQIAGVTSITLSRREDDKLSKLVGKKYFNAHTPWTVYLSLLSTVASAIYNYKNVIVSNEESANEGNAVFLGMPINHQYSKSIIYENDFREYLVHYLSLRTNFFSFLRPLQELQICKLFATMRQYHNTFRSCNVGMMAGDWCLNCAKCLSIYLTLYPFMGKKLHPIFGERFLDKTELLPLLCGLMNVKGKTKPFECVATIHEIKVAVFMCRQKAKLEGEKPFKLLEYVKRYEENDIACLNYWNKNNNLPTSHKRILRNVYNETKPDSYLVPEERFTIFRKLFFS